MKFDAIAPVKKVPSYRMECNACKQYVDDVLRQPIHPHDVYYKKYRHSRYNRIAREVCERTVEVLNKCDLSEYQQCQNMNQFSSCQTDSVLPPFQSKMEISDYRNVFLHSIRMFLYFKRKNPHLYSILKECLYLAMENGVLTKSYSIYDYEDWFAQKFIFLLYYFPSVHQEHIPKPLPVAAAPLTIRITIAVEEYDDLYQ